jgi:hypothetical protein
MKNKSLKFISVILAAFFGLLVFANSVSAATSTATYTSTVKALANSQLGIMTWNITTPANSCYVMRAKSCTASDCSDKTAWTSCALASGDNGTDISGKGCMIDGQGYVQFQVDLTMKTHIFSFRYLKYLRKHTKDNLGCDK